uniref:FBA_2 domain-containing protein n=1 Tax=Steinernema glaseri TaxID=37863 RepID=A0A1I7YGZ2_9BILA
MCCEPRLFFEGRLPLEDLEPLLRSLDNRSFSSIKIKHYNHAYDDLVRRHFSRNDKTTITVASDSWTEDELELFRSHVYSGDFWNLRISGNREHPFTSADFGLLFEKIWAMPRYPDNVFVMLDTVFERKAIEDIRVFRGDVRRQQNENSYFWQRDDGLCVVATIDEDEDMVMINSAFDGFESQH